MLTLGAFNALSVALPPLSAFSGEVAMDKLKNQPALFTFQERHTKPFQPALGASLLAPGFTPSSPEQIIAQLGLNPYQQKCFNHLPKRPYCTDELSSGLKIRGKLQAIQHRYIQMNPPHLVCHNIYDIDLGEHSCFAWEDAMLPRPNVAIINNASGNSHLVYSLSAPVLTTDIARAEPLKYLYAIDRAYTEKLKADSGYSGLIAKSVFSKDWTHMWGHDNLFSLEELAKHIDLTRYVGRNFDYQQVGVGRKLHDL